ncbi:MAG TPA: asparagine synthase (glutamine-hydrolyzing) [Gammaproteobacteria bacterium]|nr:asparagine synthase (glutamine-hydrolyzing) [Gammaproteobacteria bacterium]
MCGLTGYLTTDRVADDVLAAMTNALHHRGPDAGDTWHDTQAGIGLGHRRLSILDLSPAGAQPMHSRDGRYVIAFNGEIYNFARLRAELEKLGASFVGHSDTEVLLAGFVAWGVEATLRRTNGMFAIALWDRERRELHLARDRLGEKPLYYGWHGQAFLFASELKALHAWPGFRPEVDRDALAAYLRHNYIPDPLSIYRGFAKLMPGTWLTLPAHARPGDRPMPRAYWSLLEAAARGRAAPFDGSDEEAVEALDGTLRRSVADRMVADVPLGAFLSGGIDSSTVVALMQAQSARPVRTFSIGFTVPAYDEAPHARAVAAHLGTDHTELYVSPEETQAVIPQLATMYDEPFADSSQIPTYLVSALARRHVTVAMSGDAGDEFFAGYTRYTAAVGLWRRQARLPLVVRRTGARSLRAVPPAAWDRFFAVLGPLLPARFRQQMPGDKLHKLANLLAIDDPLAMYLRMISLWHAPERVVRGAREPATIMDIAARLPPGLDFIERMMAIDTLHYLPGDILTKVDRASMAVSLEARVPFLDHEVVELAWRMPLALKLRRNTGKWVLREVLARYVPRALFERPKMGFGVPIDAWLRGPLRDWAEALLDERRLREGGYFDPAPIRQVWQAHLAGGQNLQYLLWGVLMFEAWRERFGR